MLREVLGTIDGAVLATSTAESHLQMGEITLNISRHMMVNDLIYRVKEGQNLSVSLQEVNHRLIQAYKGFVFVVFTGVMRTTAIEDVSAAVTGCILRQTAFKGERVNRY